MKSSPTIIPLFAASTTKALTVRSDVRAGAFERRIKSREMIEK